MLETSFDSLASIKWYVSTKIAARTLPSTSITFPKRRLLNDQQIYTSTTIIAKTAHFIVPSPL